jgi:LPS-assembly lipoprotein
MSLYNRRFLLLSLAALAGCGFSPALAPGSAARSLMGAVEIAAPTNRNSFNLVKQLELNLGPAQNPRYALRYGVDTSTAGVAITSSQETTRYHVTGKANFSVLDLNSGAVVSSGKVQNFTAYSATGSTAATLSARDDAYARLMVMLADQISTRLSATAGSWVGSSAEAGAASVAESAVE